MIGFIFGVLAVGAALVLGLAALAAWAHNSWVGFIQRGGRLQA
jgi:hypothetical protein